MDIKLIVLLLITFSFLIGFEVFDLIQKCKGIFRNSKRIKRIRMYQGNL